MAPLHVLAHAGLIPLSDTGTSEALPPVEEETKSSAWSRRFGIATVGSGEGIAAGIERGGATASALDSPRTTTNPREDEALSGACRSERRDMLGLRLGFRELCADDRREDDCRRSSNGKKKKRLQRDSIRRIRAMRRAKTKLYVSIYLSVGCSPSHVALFPSAFPS